MMNSPFGKSMENIRNRVDFEITNNEGRLGKLFKKPNLKDIRIYSNNEGFLVGVQKGKTKITLDKPIYTGQCILDNSKRKMYEYIHDYCISKWGIENFKVCQTDTDSVIAEIKTKDIIKDIQPDISRWFDTGGYKIFEFDGIIIPKVNRKVLGKMKDKFGGQFMTEFVGIGPKNYAYKYQMLNKIYKDKSICKGIPKSSHPEFKEYKQVVFGEEEKIEKDCYRIGSKDHCLHTVKTNKVALSNQIRKRVKDPDSRFNTLPFGVI